MKILLISGHGAGDSGACGNGFKECDKNRELVNLIAPKLRQYATVDIYDQTRNAFVDVQNGNFNVKGYDYVLEVHFNAFNGQAHGSEIFVTTMEEGITVEQAIMKRMKKYFTLRDNDSIFDGVKRTNFLVIKTLKNRGMSGALLETCFIDNATDMKVYEANKNAIAQDITEGIAEGFGLKKVEQPKPEPKVIKEGSKVKIKAKSVYGGLSSSRGKEIPSWVLKNTYTVNKIQTNKGVKEARLKEINSWVAVSSLTLVE